MSAHACVNLNFMVETMTRKCHNDNFQTKLFKSENEIMR